MKCGVKNQRIPNESSHDPKRRRFNPNTNRSHHQNKMNARKELSMVFVVIDCIEQAVDGAVIEELDGNQKATIILPFVVFEALIRVSFLLIAHSLFVAVQRGDYIAPAFDYVSNNTLSIVFHLLISKQKLGQPNKRDKVIMAKLWFEKRKEICCVVT
eukprot:550939_1